MCSPFQLFCFKTYAQCTVAKFIVYLIATVLCVLQMLRFKLTFVGDCSLCGQAIAVVREDTQLVNGRPEVGRRLIAAVVVVA